jgi:hypothetical protein
MQSYVSAEHRKNPSFVALVLSICSLSCRYTPDARLRAPTSNNSTLALDLIALAKDVTTAATADRADLYLVQALFNLSVVQEGTARTNQLWWFLSQAVSIAFDMGLHRRKDEYNFSAVDLEEQKRTLWALYCQTVQASCTYGRPSMLRLQDIELGEPAAVDDVYISVDKGIGTQPPDRPSVMAGFVAGVRLHMILERTVRRVNRVIRDSDSNNPSFMDLVSSVTPRSFRVEDELDLLPHVTDGLVGDWSFSPSTVSDSDSVRFFQRTRVFTLQQFIRLLSARHRFTELLGSSEIGSAEEQALLQQITQSALGIVGTYSIIDTQSRLDFFGAHAISQLTQAGAGLIGVILHVRSTSMPGSDSVLQVALQGLCASILVLRKLGTRVSFSHLVHSRTKNETNKKLTCPSVLRATALRSFSSSLPVHAASRSPACRETRTQRRATSRCQCCVPCRASRRLGAAALQSPWTRSARPSLMSGLASRCRAPETCGWPRQMERSPRTRLTPPCK